MGVVEVSWKRKEKVRDPKTESETSLFSKTNFRLVWRSV